METEFTPLASLFGGALIGLAAVALMAVSGRIMGATGVLAGLVWPEDRAGALWRGVLIAGMMTGPLVYWLATGGMPVVSVPVSTGALVVGGLIVGVGVTFGGGCTSGHGVCGMARGSGRSLVATLTFMVSCFATVYVLRHVIGGV